MLVFACSAVTLAADHGAGFDEKEHSGYVHKQPGSDAAPAQRLIHGHRGG